MSKYNKIISVSPVSDVYVALANDEWTEFNLSLVDALICEEHESEEPDLHYAQFTPAGIFLDHRYNDRLVGFFKGTKESANERAVDRFNKLTQALKSVAT